MPDLLDPGRALEIARRLKLIKGYPWDEEASNAAAECLMRWCTGFIDGARVWHAEEQAEACVAELITRCAEDGLEWEGIGQLKAVFNERFKPRAPEGPSQEEQWRKKYGPPDKSWVEKLVKTAGSERKNFDDEFRDHHKQAIRDSVYYTEGQGRFELEPKHGDGEERRREKRQSQAFWAAAMEHHNREHPGEVALVRAEGIGTGEIQ